MDFSGYFRGIAMCVYLKQVDLVIKAVEISSTADEKDTALALIAMIIEQSKKGAGD